MDAGAGSETLGYDDAVAGLANPVEATALAPSEREQLAAGGVDRLKRPQLATGVGH